METVHLLISGKVQGVFFRNTARVIAEKLQITGWIKNTGNQKVEVMITGTEAQINQFINWCKIGPEKATVTDVKITKHPQTSFESFKILRN